jgi:hypothetical protein
MEASWTASKTTTNFMIRVQGFVKITADDENQYIVNNFLQLLSTWWKIEYICAWNNVFMLPLMYILQDF